MNRIPSDMFVWHPEMGDCAPTADETSALRADLRRGISMRTEDAEVHGVHVWLTADQDEALVVAELPGEHTEIKIYPRGRTIFLITVQDGQMTVDKGLELPFMIDDEALHAWSSGPLLYVHVKAKPA